MEAGNIWRVVFEACPSLKLLRVFLSSGISPAERCRGVKAQLLLMPPPAVLCEWQTDLGKDQVLHVPLPWCLVDPSAPVTVSMRADHLELKLKLLSVDVSLLELLKDEVLGRRFEAASPLCLESDARLLASEGDVVLRCKSCSANLLKAPLRRILDLPSVDWQELSDQWYGGCCCEDKAKSRSLVARCGGSLIPPAGTCLVGPSFCVVDAADVLGDAALNGIAGIRERIVSIGDDSKDVAMLQVSLGSSLGDDARCTTASRHHPSLDSAEEQCRNGDSCVEENGFSEVSCNDDLDDGETHSHHCLAANLWVDLPEPAWTRGDDRGEAMGAQVFPGRSVWTRFLCPNCSSLVGSVSKLAQRGNLVHELQLLKYHLSTDVAVGSRRDIFRYHTLQRVFANELLSRSEGDATYRFLLRDRQTKAPLLQLVVLNQEEWLCVQTEDLQVVTLGDPCEKRMDDDRVRRMPPPYDWETVLKVGFRDCDSLTDLKVVEDWARRQVAEDMYMWSEDAEVLILSLNQISSRFPASCLLFQQFKISWLEK